MVRAKEFIDTSWSPATQQLEDFCKKERIRRSDIIEIRYAVVTEDGDSPRANILIVYWEEDAV